MFTFIFFWWGITPQKTIKIAKVYEWNSDSDTLTFSRNKIFRLRTQLEIICSKLTIETAEQGVKYVQI